MTQNTPWIFLIEALSPNCKQTERGVIRGKKRIPHHKNMSFGGVLMPASSTVVDYDHVFTVWTTKGTVEVYVEQDVFKLLYVGDSLVVKIWRGNFDSSKLLGELP